MPALYEKTIQDAIDAFGKLPGIGPKGAQRIVFSLISAPEDESQTLAQAITTMRASIHFCDICGNVCEISPCKICADPRRDSTILCVVEEAKDIAVIESTGSFHGRYHVLGGVVDPMAHVQPSDLRISELLQRLRDASIKEVVIALNPTINGEATTTLLASMLDSVNITVTRLASGLPVGADLEYADAITIGRAFNNRNAVHSASSAH